MPCRKMTPKRGLPVGVNTSAALPAMVSRVHMRSWYGNGRERCHNVPNPGGTFYLSRAKRLTSRNRQRYQGFTTPCRFETFGTFMNNSNNILHLRHYMNMCSYITSPSSS